jgi:fibrillarin-like pre-rRNA processing protein
VVIDVEPHPNFKGIFIACFEDGTARLATRNLTPKRNVYGERLVVWENFEYRIWDPFRSKLAAGILKGLKTEPIQPDHKVLYLGAASGTTASHVSDIVDDSGHVYCVEFSERSIRELVNNVCTFRPNMTPILEDARVPERYAMFVEIVDEIYCDIAQPEQSRILADNANLFLKEGGWAILAVKSQSIDVTEEPSVVYKKEVKTLKDRGFRVSDFVNLEPYEKAHAMVTALYKGARFSL